MTDANAIGAAGLIAIVLFIGAFICQLLKDQNDDDNQLQPS